MEAHKKLEILSKNGIKVYPVHTKIGWKIELDVNGKKKRYDKVVTEKEINHKDWEKNPIAITIDYLVKKLGYSIN